MATATATAGLRREEAAALLGRSIRSLENYERRGWLRPDRNELTGRVRYDRSQVEELARRLHGAK